MKKIIYTLYYKFKRFIFTSLVKRRTKNVKGKIFVNRYCKMTSNTFLGNNVHFNGLKILGSGKVVIGDNFHSGQRCEFITQFHNFNNSTKIPYDNSYIIKEIIIEDNVWLGNQVMILGGVTIGEGAIIQAGSVVVSSIPKYAIAGGHPAKVFSHRDIEHYERLKNLKQFN